jgi:hypothetical protein
MKGMGGDHITSSGIFEVSGSVGIGTTNPTSPLSLYYPSTASDINYIKMEMPSWGGSTNYKKNIIWHDSGNVVGGIGMSFTSPYTYMDFHSFYNGAHTTGSLMRIQGNGNVGIGTTSPSGLLQVGVANSGIYFDTTTQYTPKIIAAGTISDIQIQSVGNGGNVYLNAPGTTSLINFQVNGSERMRITSAGRVAIGRTSPGTALSVAGQSEQWQLALSTDTGSGAVIGSPSANVLAFGDWAGTEKVRIESGGKVVAPYGYQSFKGNITLTAGNTGTIYTMAADGLYTVYVRFYGASGIFMASSIVTSLFTNGESFIASIKTASNVGISVSGNNIQVGNGGFATYTFQWSILFQPVDF